MNQSEKRDEGSAKVEWVQPEIKRLSAGSAESLDGPRPDGGGGFQGS